MGRRSARYRPWPRGGRRGRAPLPLCILLGAALALVCIRVLDGAVRPTVTALAQAKVRNAVTSIVDGAVAGTLEEGGLSYEDVVTLQTDGAGAVTAVTTSPAKLNALKTRILQEVVRQVDALDSEALAIPLGSITGLAAASDWGPDLPVRVLPAASADGEFRNEFTSAGINQTLHRIVLDVQVDVCLLIPGGRTDTRVSVSVCLAETVIVGEVPEAYLELPGAG